MAGEAAKNIAMISTNTATIAITMKVALPLPPSSSPPGRPTPAQRRRSGPWIATPMPSSVAMKKPTLAAQMRTKSPNTGFQRPVCPPTAARITKRRL